MSDPSDPREDPPDDEQPDDRELEQDLGADAARDVEERIGEPEALGSLSETAQKFLDESD
jgi:hypothetical protein